MHVLIYTKKGDNKMKKLKSKFFAVFMSVLLITMSISSSAFAKPLDGHSPNFKLYTTDYLDSSAAYLGSYVHTTNMYFKDYRTAINFAGTLPVSNTVSRGEEALCIILGIATSSQPLIAIAATVVWGEYTFARNDLYNHIVSAANATTNGYVKVVITTITMNGVDSTQMSATSWDGTTYTYTPGTCLSQSYFY